MTCLQFYKHFLFLSGEKFHPLDLTHNIKPFSFGDLEVISATVVNFVSDIIKQMCREAKTGHTASQLQGKE